MRKGHGSTKVPGVKLRPAPKIVAARAQTDDGDADESAPSASNTQLNSHGPLAGVVVCATGLSNKTQLFNQAKQLGAATSTHLTNLTTHLLADEAGSAKYLCALERGIPIMSPDWVRTSHAIWISGGEVDLDESVNQYRLPIFRNLKLCLTGFEDVQERMRLHSTVSKNGGVYSKGFEPSVTHLLVCGTSGESVKTQTALRLNKTRAPENQIHVIWEDWLWDCLEYGGMWDTAQYSFENPRPQRKPPKPTPSLVAKATPAPLPPSIQNDLLIRADDPSESAHAKHMPGISSQIWGTIMKARGCTVDDAGKLRVGSQEFVPPASDEHPARGAVISRVSSAKAAALHASAAKPAPRQSFERVASVAGPSRLPALRATSSLAASLPTTSSQLKVFAGKTFFSLGSANCDALAAAVQSNGGIWLSSRAAADFVLVRLTESGLFWDECGLENGRGRTECWVEKCLYDDRIVHVDEHLTFAPLQNAAPLPGAEGLTLAFSGLTSAEGCWMKRLVRAIGANYSPNFTRKCTHLVCDSAAGAKSERAVEWNVPVVSTKWLFDLATGDEAPTQQEQQSTGSQSRQTGETMADITNASRSASVDFSSLGFESMSADAPAGDDEPRGSLGQPSLLVQRVQRVASMDEMDAHVVKSSCTPSPLKFPSPHASLAELDGAQSAPASLTGKRGRSDDSAGRSAKKARPGSRSKVALERGSSVVSVRSVSTPVPTTTHDSQTGPSGTQEESMLVTYRDPGGEAARSKLFQLLSGPEKHGTEVEAASKKTVRAKGKQVDSGPKSSDAPRKRGVRTPGF